MSAPALPVRPVGPVPGASGLPAPGQRRIPVPARRSVPAGTAQEHPWQRPLPGFDEVLAGGVQAMEQHAAGEQGQDEGEPAPRGWAPGLEESLWSPLGAQETPSSPRGDQPGAGRLTGLVAGLLSVAALVGVGALVVAGVCWVVSVLPGLLAM